MDRVNAVTMAGPGVTPAKGSLRLVRASLFAGCAVWLSLIAHVAGGGTAPTWGAVVGLALVTAAVGSLWAGRQRGHLGIAGTMLAVQFLLHQIFAALSAGSGCHLLSAAGGPFGSGPAHTGMPMTSTAAGCADPHQAGAAMAGMGTAMLIWHLLAAVVLAVLLAQGERTLWTVLTWFLPRLPSTVVVPALSAAIRCPGLRSPFRPRIELLSSGVGRRGPPFARGALA